jgi:hypothetical protein
MQWSQGRTRRNLLHSVSEQSKMQNTSGVLSACRSMFCTHQTCPILCQCFPTLDNLRNLFLTPTMEMLSFFQNLRAQ